MGFEERTPFPAVGINKTVEPSAATAVANVGCVTVDDTLEMCGCRVDLIVEDDWPLEAAAATEAS